MHNETKNIPILDSIVKYLKDYFKKINKTYLDKKTDEKNGIKENIKEYNKPSHWLDFNIECDDVYSPINIKISGIKSADNVDSKDGLYYALTGKQLKNDNVYEKYFQNLKNNLQENNKDYYCLIINLIINKNDLNDNFYTSLETLNKIQSHDNDLPFQAKWDDNKHRINRDYNEAKHLLLHNLEKSLELAARAYSVFKECFGNTYTQLNIEVIDSKDAPKTAKNTESKDENKLIFDLVKYGNKKIEKLVLQDKSEVDSILQNLRKDSYKVDSINNKESVTKTKPPFMTSTLQQSASNLLGFSPTRTMSIAQRLYEGVKTNNGISGIITYMRTDSLNIAKEALSAARDFIKDNFKPEYLPPKAKIYATKQKSAQEAHEAIRPTNLNFTPQIAKAFLKDDELKLYTLIFNRFIASQMNDAIFESLSVSVVGRDCKSEFKINGRKLVFDGFYAIMGNNEKDKLLPNFTLGQDISFDRILDIKKVTEPPPHFSEAGLIKTLESLGIGRPSTYAPTIKLLIDRHYVENVDKKLVAQDVAFNVIEMLEKNFNEIVDSGFSAALETKLDSIAERKNDWQKVLWDFYEPFIKQIESGKANIESQKIAKPTGEMCPQCGSELVLRNGRYGEFVACSNYPTCKYVKRDSKDDLESSGEKCEKCGADMVVKMGRNGKFLACSGYPKCKNAKPLVKPKTAAVKCPKCGGDLIERHSKRGVFYGCSNYPKCNFLLNGEPVRKCECGGILYKPKNKKDVLICSDCKKTIESNS
ncbi:type I DNA topoisomerase [Helicobacter saguini]|uniref:Type I DNA topoisomerase n=1 Tax=Helicobacter saguini TaxID=1548018 RepID=A0A347W747_9HELI|nr:type I DNA topoisomerase [Helicobacter saguini]MWV67016.1 type I DNA topoisomerase [Helicobacter saguini]MWV69364.1 type I DNA topoisomerase [Helicobacter saguini]MWV71081.1 type I DNA topoisomerase [Helicobacter saguini]TLD95082.1 type I DNA topoisomerase [Helicobacter saguini]